MQTPDYSIPAQARSEPDALALAGALRRLGRARNARAVRTRRVVLTSPAAAAAGTAGAVVHDDT